MLGYVSQLQDEGVDGKDIEAAQMRLDKEKIVNLRDGRTSLFQCAKQTIIINTADTDILRQHGVSRWTINPKVADGLMVWEGNKGVQLKRLIASKYKTDLGKQQVVRLADWDYRFNRMQVGAKSRTERRGTKRKMAEEEQKQKAHDAPQYEEDGFLRRRKRFLQELYEEQEKRHYKELADDVWHELCTLALFGSFSDYITLDYQPRATEGKIDSKSLQHGKNSLHKIRTLLEDELMLTARSGTPISDLEKMTLQAHFNNKPLFKNARKWTDDDLLVHGGDL